MNESSQRTLAVIRTAFFASLFIFFMMFWVPSRVGMVRFELRPGTAWWQLLGWPLMVLGGALGLWCVFAFAFIGLGTPAPFDPPRRLVVAGLYRYVRNPMYDAALLFMTGLWLTFGQARWAAILYPAVLMLLVTLLVAFHEEPSLRRKFGDDYVEYCRNVGRFIPRLTPWRGDGKRLKTSGLVQERS